MVIQLFPVALALILASPGEVPPVGKPPPEVGAKTWFNNLGPEPSLANLKGQVVLIEYWATWCPPCRAAWPHLNELYSTYAKDGLVVLGLSDETDDKVEPFIGEYNIECIVGGGSNSAGKYGVKGIPHTFVIGPDGNLAWEGNPVDLREDLLKNLLKGARKPTGGILGVRMLADVDPRVAKAKALAADGKLNEALKDLAAIESDPKSTEQQKADAQAVREAVEMHAESLSAAAEKAFKSADVEKGVALLEALSKELGATPLGSKAKSRIQAVRADPKLVAELDASKAFSKLQEQVKTLSTSKLRSKYEDFAKRYPGTKAGERAKLLSRTAEKG